MSSRPSAFRASDRCAFHPACAFRRPAPVRLAVLLFAGVVGCAGAESRGEVAGPVLPSGSERLDFVGTEPFFAGFVEGTALSYATPELRAPRTGTVAAQNESGVRRYVGTLTGEAFSLSVWVAPCSDGMSDRSYPFTVDVSVGDVRLTGCGFSAAHRPVGEDPP